MGRNASLQAMGRLLHQRFLMGAGRFPQRGNAILGVLEREQGQANLTGSVARRWMNGYSGIAGNVLQAEIMAFNKEVPVEQAVTPPSAWYTSPEIFNLELEKIFEKRWQAVGRVNQLQKPGEFFTGKVGRVQYVVCMDEQRTLRAFHNVCRHRAAAVATGSGCASSFVCPYHGWTDGLDGKLRKASRLGGIENFMSRENGLLPLHVDKWGPFVLICVPSKTASDSIVEKKVLGSITKAYTAEQEWLGRAAKTLTEAKIDCSLQHVATREYILNCNWKVYCDNFADGGYHVPFAHIAYAAELDVKSFKTELSEKVSIQTCQSAETNTGGALERIGERATYAFVYPNFMINRYGPWMDTNLVLPVTASQCRVIFNYFLEPSLVHDEAFIKNSLERSDLIQQEDIMVCEAVQNGLQSPAYDVGRYAPSVEHAVHHFHTLLHDDLSGESDQSSDLQLDDMQHALLRHSSSQSLTCVSLYLIAMVSTICSVINGHRLHGTALEALQIFPLVRPQN